MAGCPRDGAGGGRGAGAAKRGQTEVSCSSQAVPAVDRQRVGGCSSPKPQLFSSVIRYNLSFLGANLQLQKESAQERDGAQGRDRPARDTCSLPAPSLEASLILCTKAAALFQPPACDRRQFRAPLKSQHRRALGMTPVRADDHLKAILSQASPKTTGGRAVGEACATWRLLGQKSCTPCDTRRLRRPRTAGVPLPALVPSAGCRWPGTRRKAAHCGSSTCLSMPATRPPGPPAGWSQMPSPPGRPARARKGQRASRRAEG